MMEPAQQNEHPVEQPAEVNTEPAFKPDFRIAGLSAIGILGFIVGCVMLFYDDLGNFCKTDAVFHEVGYQPRVYAQALVENATDSLKYDTIILNTHVTKVKDTTKDSIIKAKLLDSLNKKIKTDTEYIARLAEYAKYYEELSIQDTTGFTYLNKALHFQITSDSINKWDCVFAQMKLGEDTSITNNDSLCCVQKAAERKIGSVNYYLKDKALPFKISGSAAVTIIKHRSDVEFISKYPNAGIWLILVLIFCSFCFTAIATAVYQKTKVETVFPEGEKGKLWGKYYLICFITALFMLLMAFTWDRTFYDDDIVKNLFFMKRLDTSMLCVIILGSAAGAFCLAGFIYTASMVNYFAEPFVKLRAETEQLQEALKKLKADPQQAAANQEDITKSETLLKDKEEALSGKNNNFIRLTGIFQNYFLMASVILSLMVLCTGALFSTVNSLDFVKLLADDWGYSPVRGEYVYLYGGLYTVILLLVYVPAKMRFSEVDADVWGTKTTPPAENAKWYDFIKDPFGKMKDILVATSPFLISIIQSLFDTLFK